MTDPRSQKRRLRRELVRRILDLAPADRAREESALVDRFAELLALGGAPTVLLYASAFPEEVDTRPFLERALSEGKRLLLPRVDRDARMLRLHEVKDLAADLIPGVLGIPEPNPASPEIDPAEVDWVLVPGLAFDGDANRLGRGAGLYDRLLPTLRPRVPRWAVCFDVQWVDRLPVEPHDAPLDGVISPSRTVIRPR